MYSFEMILKFQLQIIRWVGVKLLYTYAIC